jgi:RNA polymerase sigma-70 factor, ECF subfamily
MGKVRFDIVGQLPALRRYARSLARNPADAEDLVHDALLRAHQRRATFRSGSRPLPWLIAILQNTFIDGLRRTGAQRRREGETADLFEEGLNPSQEHAVRLTQIRRAFDRLPDDQRAALHLVAIEGLTYQDAAEALSIPIGTLMSRIGRARAALRSFEDGVTDRPALRLIGGRDD